MSTTILHRNNYSLQKIIFVSFLLAITLCTETIFINHAQAELKTYNIPSHGMLKLNVPKNWQDKVTQPPGELPPTIKFQSGSPEDFSLLITVMWSIKKEMVINPEKIKRYMNRSIEQLLPSAVETNLTPEKLNCATNHGYFFTITDKKLVGKTLESGEYLYLTSVNIIVEDLLLVTSILSNTKNSTDVQNALSMVCNATK